MRDSFAKILYRLFPFDLRGDCAPPEGCGAIKLSCIINFYGRLDLLSGILSSLAEQRFPREALEVLLVEDRGGTEGGRGMAEAFGERLPIVYAPLTENFGQMGYARNFALARSRGELILFLDDDTVLLQEDFLSRLCERFDAHPEADALVPRGRASFSVVEGRYDYHDPYFMTSRCTAYRRSVLARLGGFVDQFIGQEDVEFVIRFLFARCTSLRVPELEYFHPPLLVGNFRKPMAVGQSFFRVRNRYPLPVWLLILVNCARHAPLYLVPGRRNREMGRFGAGFIAGVVASVFKREGFRYG